MHDRKQNSFGDVVDGEMVLNNAGKYAMKCWMEIPKYFAHAKLDEYAVMPNHIHGIVIPSDRRGTACRAPKQNDDGVKSDTAYFFPTHDDGMKSGTACRAPTGIIEQFGKPTAGTIPTIIRSFKSATSKHIRQSEESFKWQRNYYENIIRDEKALCDIRKYIRENPVNWNIDFENHIAREIRELGMAEIQNAAKQ